MVALVKLLLCIFAAFVEPAVHIFRIKDAGSTNVNGYYIQSKTDSSSLSKVWGEEVIEYNDMNGGLFLITQGAQWLYAQPSPDGQMQLDGWMAMQGQAPEPVVERMVMSEEGSQLQSMLESVAFAEALSAAGQNQEAAGLYDQIVLTCSGSSTSKVGPEFFSMTGASAETCQDVLLPTVLTRVAALQLRMGLVSGAKKALEQVLEKTPQDAMTRVRLAAVYILSAQVDEAKELIGMFTDQEELFQVAGQVQKELAKDGLDCLGPAVGVLSPLSKGMTTATDVYKMMPMQLYRAGAHTEALAHLQKQLELTPDSTPLQLELIGSLPRVYASAQELDETRQALESKLTQLQEQSGLTPFLSTELSIPATQFMFYSQGGNDLDLLLKLNTVLTALLPPAFVSVSPHLLNPLPTDTPASEVMQATNFFRRPYLLGTRNNFDGEVGIEFQTHKPLLLSALGRALGSPRARKLKANTTVTLWDTASESALVSVVVGPHSRVVKGYANEPIQGHPSGFPLQGMHTFRLTLGCTVGMPDKWVDDYPLEDFDNALAAFMGGVYGTEHKGYPGTHDGALRRAGVTTFWGSVDTAAIATTASSTDAELVKAKVKVGFVSAFFSYHSVCLVFCGVITQIAKEQKALVQSGRGKASLRLFVLGTEDTDADGSGGAMMVMDNMQGAGAEVRRLPRSHLQALGMLRELELDVLVFSDIGFHPWTQWLPFSRSAPAQVAFWGHHGSSALPHVDYYIASPLFESPPVAALKHSEQLVFLEGTTVVFRSPQDIWPNVETNSTDALQEARASYRASFASTLGLQAALNKRWYLIPQNLIKLHPLFDGAISGILSADPDALILISYSKPHVLWNAKLHTRLYNLLGKSVAQRVLAVPQMPHPELMKLISAADVCLDTFPIGGGITSLEILSVGTPVITLPDLQSTMHLTAGLYEAMGLNDIGVVAHSIEEYVSLATAAASNGTLREHIQQQTLSHSGALYSEESNSATADEWTRFLVHAGSSRGSSLV
jgi:tetratricopeptide (TPR) repeat protein